jgi:AcrR family transcriptional regulator
MARTGRRPGNQDTREAILDSARKAFSDRGYDGASIRAIATGAGVDPALVHHYFGTKEQLFLATIKAPVNPGELIPQALGTTIEGAGERLVTTFLSVWDSPAGSTAVALIRSAVQHEWSARMLREFMVTQILRRAVKALDIDPAEASVRSSLVATQIMGLAMARYIIKIEPMVDMAPEAVVRLIGPTIQHYLEDPLDL